MATVAVAAAAALAVATIAAFAAVFSTTIAPFVAIAATLLLRLPLGLGLLLGLAMVFTLPVALLLLATLWLATLLLMTLRPLTLLPLALGLAVPTLWLLALLLLALLLGSSLPWGLLGWVLSSSCRVFTTSIGSLLRLWPTFGSLFIAVATATAPASPAATAPFAVFPFWASVAASTGKASTVLSTFRRVVPLEVPKLGGVGVGLHIVLRQRLMKRRVRIRAFPMRGGHIARGKPTFGVVVAVATTTTAAAAATALAVPVGRSLGGLATTCCAFGVVGGFVRLFPVGFDGDFHRAKVGIREIANDLVGDRHFRQIGFAVSFYFARGGTCVVPDGVLAAAAARTPLGCPSSVRIGLPGLRGFLCPIRFVAGDPAAGDPAAGNPVAGGVSHPWRFGMRGIRHAG
jgi:hypothetical protein